MPYYKKNLKNFVYQALGKIKESIYIPVKELKVTAWVTSEPVPFENRLSGEKKGLSIGDTWGQLWDCGWFHFTGEVPKSATNKKVVFLIDVSGEGCVFDNEGCPIRGLTNVSSTFDTSLGKPGKRVVQFLQKAKGEEKVDIWVETGCNDLFGVYKDKGILKEACIAVCNEDIRQLYYDFEVLYNMLEILPENEARYNTILFALDETLKILIGEINEQNVQKARKILFKELNKKGGDPSLTVSAIGHAHIDLAWLWPIRETIRKGSRTFSTVLEMMDRYPDYVFGASQPQLYQWIKEKYPLLYEKIKNKVKEGRWETQGGMWVEADTNVSGGEALVRQVLYGKRFFRDEFDKDMKILWLPDVFGYTGALPQILKKTGIDYFMTIKLSWSEHNKFPHQTFNWQGIDGSVVLAHMPPEGTYNSAASPVSVKKAERNFLDKGLSDKCLMLFGIGDGGGGPGAEHLERLKRMKDLSGLPPVVQEPTLNFFKDIEKDRVKYKTWVGELYLEKHQGTYTTQAKNKWYNRKMEIVLRELEYISTLVMIYTDGSYPQEKIEKIWKEILLYQFHDILPGSSIKRVYEESVERYKILYDEVEKLTQQAYKKLIEKIDTSNKNKPYVIFNSLPWDRKEWINIEDKWINIKIPHMGYIVIDTDDKFEIPISLEISDNHLENEYLKITFNKDGTIYSIFDKENNCDVLEKDSVGNILSIYKDYGDAWDFPINYDEQIPEILIAKEAKVYINGPKAVMEQTYIYGKSEIVQEVVLTAGSRRIDFNTKVKWNESNKMLRTLFPVNVYTNEAVCDIQFGNIKRPTHRNTSWDMAKYEICAHKWVDISRRDYGVALLNDCKYGYKVINNILDLNLLRSPNYPGINADKVEHEFTYSLYPHIGDSVEGRVDQIAEELNTQIYITKTKAKSALLSNNKSFISVDSQNIMIEAVKKAEDSNEMIIRMFETAGMKIDTKITFENDLESVKLVDMMEENSQELLCKNNETLITFKPFEIHTLCIKNKKKNLK